MSVEVQHTSATAPYPAAAAARDRVDPVRRVLAGAPLALLALLLALLLRYPALRLGNQDTWFHLALGDRFRSGWSLTHPGGLTPFASSSWVPTQWSTEMLASWVDDAFGLPGVAWLFGACYLALAVGSYLSCRRLGSALASAVATALVVFGCAPVLSARPQVVSVVLLVVVVAAWLRTEADGRVRWWLVPLTWVWATAHGLWSAGVLLGLVAAVGLVLDRRVTGRRAVGVVAVPVLSLLAALLTPVGPRLLTSQLAVSARTSMIPEWGPTSFRSVPSLCVAVMIGLVALLWARQGQVTWTRLGLLLLAAGWTLLVARLVALGAVVTAPLLVEALQRRPLGPGRRPPVGAGAVRRTERLVVAAMTVLYLVALALAAPRAVDHPADVPERLAPRLAALPSGSTLLVEDGIGGWVEWRQPDVHPVIDGMLDAYPVPYIRRFFAMTHVEPGWRRFVTDSGARVGILQARSPLTDAVEHQLGWRVVQRDGGWVYVEAPGP